MTISVYRRDDDKVKWKYESLRCHDKTIHMVDIRHHAVWFTWPPNVPVPLMRAKSKFSQLAYDARVVWDKLDGPYMMEQLKLLATGKAAPYYVNVYMVDQQYGGPEEGGWYYDRGEPYNLEPYGRSTFRASSEDAAQTIAAILRAQIEQPLTYITSSDGFRTIELPHHPRHSVLGIGDIEVMIEDLPARPYPSRRPHYE